MELPSLKLEDDSLRNRVLELLSPLVIDETKVSRLVTVLQSEIQLGLCHGLKGSSLQMENTFIPCLLDGTETGQYLALDLGGTNFRVILVKMLKGKMVNEVISYYTVEEKLRLGPGENLFRFLAQCIKDFLVKQKLPETEKFPLGFTFSFPMTQLGLNVGLLVNWTKSFNCPGVIGEDVVKMLNTALSSEGVTNVEVVAILNDTTGTLVAGSHDYPDTGIGLILGTGTNAAYIEHADKIIRWEDRGSVDHCIMDPEWGAWGDNGTIDFIKTSWDRDLDAASLLPGSFTYEKYFAGKYLGELARTVFVGVLEALGRPCPAAFLEKDSITTEDVSKIVQDERVSSLTEDLELETILLYICRLLSERAAVMVAVPIATLLNRMERGHTTIAVTGSLYKLHPTMASRLEHHTNTLSTYSHSYRLCDDGSGKGAALVAAIASRLAAVV